MTNWLCFIRFTISCVTFLPTWLVLNPGLELHNRVHVFGASFHLILIWLCLEKDGNICFFILFFIFNSRFYFSREKLILACPHLASNHFCSELWLLNKTWWRHQMETFSPLLALCDGNPPVTDGFPPQRPVTRSFDVFFWSAPEQTFQQTIETPVVWSAIGLIMMLP